VIQDGELHLSIVGRAPLALSAGDIVVLPHPARYRLSDGSRPDAGLDAPLEIEAADIPVLEHGQGAVAVRTISATFQFESKGGVSPLLGLLPDVIHIARDADQSAVLIRDVARFLVVEHAAREPGAALMISRVIDILIIRCIRTWAKSLGPGLADIAAVQDQPVMGVQRIAVRRHRASSAGLDSRPASCRGPGRCGSDAEDMGVDRDGRFAEGDVQHHIGGLAADPGQRLQRLAVARHLAAMRRSGSGDSAMTFLALVLNRPMVLM
jgi:hypothetical protein